MGFEISQSHSKFRSRAEKVLITAGRLYRHFCNYRSFFLIFLILFLFMFSSVYGLRQMGRSLKDLQEHDSVALQSTMQLRQAYRDLSFRMASYCAGALPAQSVHTRLLETEKKIRKFWPAYFGSLNLNSLPIASKLLVIHLNDSIEKGHTFISDLKAAYARDDRKAVLHLLKEHWPEIQASIMAPLDRLSEEHEMAVRQNYEKAFVYSQYLTVFEIFIFITGVIALFLIARRMENLRRQYQQQVNLNISSSRLAALGEMAGGIAHEINTPLTVIQMSAEQIQRSLQRSEVDPARMLKASEVIAKTTIRIDKIIKGLRSFARDGKNDPYQTEAVQSIVEETLDLCREKFRHLEIELQLSMPEVPIKVECRPTQIAQVLLNILNNSYDAVQKLSEKWIRLEVQPLGGNVEISVMDSGEGIPFEVQDRLMEPFFTTKEVGKGMGLGLSVSRGIIQSHTGDLYYDENSENTRFVIRLPYVQDLRKLQFAGRVDAGAELEPTVSRRWARVRESVAAGFHFLF